MNTTIQMDTQLYLISFKSGKNGGHYSSLLKQRYAEDDNSDNILCLNQKLVKQPTGQVSVSPAFIF